MTVSLLLSFKFTHVLMCASNRQRKKADVNISNIDKKCILNRLFLARYREPMEHMLTIANLPLRVVANMQRAFATDITLPCVTAQRPICAICQPPRSETCYRSETFEVGSPSQNQTQRRFFFRRNIAPLAWPFRRKQPGCASRTFAFGRHDSARGNGAWDCDIIATPKLLASRDIWMVISTLHKV